MADFDLAVKYIRALPKEGEIKITQEQQLLAYKLFKQATEGDVKGSQPWAIQVEARAKWDAWNSVKGMSADEAKTKYVQFIEGVNPNWKSHAATIGVN